MTGGSTTTQELQHTYGVKLNGKDECPLCPGEHGGPGPCDQSRYSVKQRRFVNAHLEAYVTAYFNPDKRSASNELARLSREYATLPSGHICWCWCPMEDAAHGYPACKSCLKLRANQKPQEAPEIGHTRAVHATLPDVVMLDWFASGLVA